MIVAKATSKLNCAKFEKCITSLLGSSRSPSANADTPELGTCSVNAYYTQQKKSNKPHAIRDMPPLAPYTNFGLIVVHAAAPTVEIAWRGQY